MNGTAAHGNTPPQPPSASVLTLRPTTPDPDKSDTKFLTVPRQATLALRFRPVPSLQWPSRAGEETGCREASSSAGRGHDGASCWRWRASARTCLALLDESGAEGKPREQEVGEG